MHRGNLISVKASSESFQRSQPGQLFVIKETRPDHLRLAFRKSLIRNIGIGLAIPIAIAGHYPASNSQEILRK
jgi:hypothetical protein